MFLRSVASSLGGAGQLLLSGVSGNASTTSTTTTTAAGTNIQATATAGGQALVWFSEPLAEAITISGTVTPNLRGAESAATVNAGAGILIERTDAAGTVLAAVVAVTNVPVTITEWTTADSAKTTGLTPTSTAFSAGERIKVTLSHRAAGGTMAAGTATFTYGTGVSGAGNSYIDFTENLRISEQWDASLTPFFGGGYR